MQSKLAALNRSPCGCNQAAASSMYNQQNLSNLRMALFDSTTDNKSVGFAVVPDKAPFAEHAI